MKSIRLLNRCDTKFYFSVKALPELLEKLKSHYRIVEIDGRRIFEYETLYFDTPDNLLYRQHHNKNLNRYKIRFRKYKNSGLCYFEIKFKSNKGRTKKSRIKVGGIETLLKGKLKGFAKNNLAENSAINVDSIEPRLWSFFNRITLASIKHKERITIDFNMSFNTEEKGLKKVNHLVIAEVKQDRHALNTPFMNIVREIKIHPSGFSKYCIGMAMSNMGSIKYNRFKEKLLRIKKICTGEKDEVKSRNRKQSEESPEAWKSLQEVLVEAA